MSASTAYKADIRQSIVLTPDLAEIEKLMMAREGFETHSDAQKHFLRVWSDAQALHFITGPWICLPPNYQAQADSDLLRLLRSGKGADGAWMEGILRIFIGRLHSGEDNKKEPIPVPAVEAVRADQKRTLFLNPFLHEVQAIIMWRERYRSPADIYRSDLRYYAMLQKTKPLRAMTVAEAAEFDFAMLEKVQSGKPAHGSWLVNRITSLIAALPGPEDQKPTRRQVLNRISIEILKALRAFR